MTFRLSVGFHHVDTSLAALRWAIDVARTTDAELTVVHASTEPIKVQNGPSSAIAHRMGNPTWATVHSIVQGLGAPSATTTIIEPGDVDTVLRRHAREADALVLGHRRRSWFNRRDTKRSLERHVRIPILRIDETSPTPIGAGPLVVDELWDLEQLSRSEYENI